MPRHCCHKGGDEEDAIVRRNTAAALDFNGRPGAALGTALYVFAIRAARDPQVMSRVAAPFAQRNIVPHQLCCRASEQWLLIDIEVELEAPKIAELLLQKIRSIVLVERVNLVEGNC